MQKHVQVHLNLGQPDNKKKQTNQVLIYLTKHYKQSRWYECPTGYYVINNKIIKTKKIMLPLFQFKLYTLDRLATLL